MSAAHALLVTTSRWAPALACACIFLCAPAALASPIGLSYTAQLSGRVDFPAVPTDERKPPVLASTDPAVLFPLAFDESAQRLEGALSTGDPPAPTVLPANNLIVTERVLTSPGVEHVDVWLFGEAPGNLFDEDDLLALDTLVSTVPDQIFELLDTTGTVLDKVAPLFANPLAETTNPFLNVFPIAWLGEPLPEDVTLDDVSVFTNESGAAPLDFQLGSLLLRPDFTLPTGETITGFLATMRFDPSDLEDVRALRFRLAVEAHGGVPVPEPASLALLGLGLGASSLLGLRRRRL